MNWSNAMTAGFLSAAIVLDDAEFERVRPGIAPALHDALQRALPAPHTRRAALPGLLAQLVPSLPEPAEVPVRARPLVAAHFPRDLARIWHENVPIARPGFRAPAAFAAWLRKAVERGASRARSEAP